MKCDLIGTWKQDYNNDNEQLFGSRRMGVSISVAPRLIMGHVHRLSGSSFTPAQAGWHQSLRTCSVTADLPNTAQSGESKEWKKLSGDTDTAEHRHLNTTTPRLIFIFSLFKKTRVE